jgi:hypothetical protein
MSDGEVEGLKIPAVDHNYNLGQLAQVSASSPS